jgi:NADPH2:quinone reductase
MVTLLINANTSFAAFFHRSWLRFPPPFSPTAQKFDYAAKSIIIIGAGSNCGRVAIKFAKIAGSGMIIAVASLSGEKVLRDLGAIHVTDRNSKSLVAEVKTICGAIHGREEVFHVYDCVNYTFELAAEMVSNSKKSVIAVLHPPKSAVEELKKLGKYGISTASTVAVSKSNFDVETGKLVWKSLGKWVVEGKAAIPKFRMVNNLDAGLVNEALDTYRKLSGAPQIVVHPNGNGNGK